jgi:hypothetical protein
MGLVIMSFKHVFRAWLWRWHQRLGVAAALAVVVICITGILLNHTSELQLAKSSVQSDWLLKWYGLEKQSQQGLTDNAGTYNADEKTLYLNGQYKGSCLGGLVGAAPSGLGTVMACRYEAHIFSDSGDLLDTIKPAYGLPIPIESIALCEANTLVISSAGQDVLFDLESLNIKHKPNQCLGSYYELTEVTIESSTALDWQKVIQDLHSGRIFGKLGVYLFDVAAIMLLFLSLSGFWLWYSRGKGRRG